MAEDVVPEPGPQRLHGGAGADQGGVDEEEGPPHLEEQGQVALRLRVGEAMAGQLLEDIVAAGQGTRFGGLVLFPDVVIQPLQVAVEDVKDKEVGRQPAVLAPEGGHRGTALAGEPLYLLPDPVHDRGKQGCAVRFRGKAGDPAVGLPALPGKGVGGDGVRHMAQKAMFAAGEGLLHGVRFGGAE